MSIRDDLAAELAATEAKGKAADDSVNEAQRVAIAAGAALRQRLAEHTEIWRNVRRLKKALALAERASND